MRNLHTELWKNRLGLDEAIHWYPQDKDKETGAHQGSMISRNYAEAGNRFETAFMQACYMFGLYSDLVFDQNRRGGALWDIMFKSGGWHEEIKGHYANLKGSNVERISTIGALETRLPFRTPDKHFRQRDGITIVRQWIAESGYSNLRLVKPSNLAFEDHFVRRAETNDWRGCAMLMGQSNWRKTQLGHKFYVYFYMAKGVRGFLNSISISRQLIHELEVEIQRYDAQADADDNAQQSLVDPRAHRHGYLPNHAQIAQSLSRPLSNSQQAQYAERIWHTSIRPQGESKAEDEASVFMRTKPMMNGGHVWKLQNPAYVDEKISIITPELSQMLMRALPVGGM